jgi:hypothetical protein
VNNPGLVRVVVNVLDPEIDPPKYIPAGYSAFEEVTDLIQLPFIEEDACTIVKEADPINPNWYPSFSSYILLAAYISYVIL